MKKPLATKLIAAAALLVLATGVFAWRKEAQRDKLSDVAAALAGKGATDCGRASLDPIQDYDNYQSLLSADYCTEENFKARKPFFARYDAGQRSGKYPISYEAVVGTEPGKIYVLSTSHPENKSSIKQQLIPNPRIVKTYNREFLKCR